MPGEVERAEQIFYIRCLRPGMIAFDVGANIGEISLLFLHFVQPDGQVHAFEPTAQTYAKLATILQEAGRDNVVLNQKAVSDKNGTVSLYVYDRQHVSWNSLAHRPLEQYGENTIPIGTEDVESITIDSYCERNRIDHIDLLKADVEGAEYQVFLGAEKMLEAKRIHCLIFEFGATTFDMGNTPDDIRAYLSRKGYHLSNLMPGQPVFPGGSSGSTAQFSMHLALPKSR